MSDEELDEMIDLADPNHEGLVNYLGMSSNIICSKNAISIRGISNKEYLTDLNFFLSEFVMMLAKDNGKKSSSHPGKSKKRSKPSTTTGKKKPDISKSSSNANIKTVNYF